VDEAVRLPSKALTLASSLAISLLLWVAVQLLQPAGYQYESVPVAIVNFDKYQDKYITPSLENTLVRIDGPQDQLPDDGAAQRVLRENRVYVYVDFANAHPGVDRYPIKVAYSHRDPQFMFNPIVNTVQVDIQTKAHKPLPISVEATGQIPQTLSFVYNGATSDPSIVQVQGPASEVNRVKKVRAFIDLNQVTGTPREYQEVSLEPLDENDNPVALATVTPQAVEVFPSVAPAAQSRTVLVEADLERHVAPGFTVTDFTVEPNQIAVQGPPEILARLRVVKTKPISLDGLRASATYDQQLELPAGVKAYSVKSVRVQVTIEQSDSSPGSSPASTSP